MRIAWFLGKAQIFCATTKGQIATLQDRKTVIFVVKKDVLETSVQLERAVEHPSPKDITASNASMLIVRTSEYSLVFEISPEISPQCSTSPK